MTLGHVMSNSSKTPQRTERKGEKHEALLLFVKSHSSVSIFLQCYQITLTGEAIFITLIFLDSLLVPANLLLSKIDTL